MKYVRRKLMKTFRKAGIPFLDACKLAKLKEKGFPSVYELENAGFQAEPVTYCECCGPEFVNVTMSDGSTHTFSYFTFDLR